MEKRQMNLTIRSPISLQFFYNLTKSTINMVKNITIWGSAEAFFQQVIDFPLPFSELLFQGGIRDIIIEE